MMTDENLQAKQTLPRDTRLAQDPARRRPRTTRRLAELTKPLGSLGQLEDVVIRIANMTGRVIPEIEHPALLIFAGDHGVVEEGVSAYGFEVTEEMVVNICMGGSVSSVLARQQDMPVTVVDVGVRHTVRHPAALVRKIAYGTTNFTLGPAMTRFEASGIQARLSSWYQQAGYSS